MSTVGTQRRGRGNGGGRNKNKNNENDDEEGRRVYVKSKDLANKVSRQISMAALPDSIKGFPVRVLAGRADAINVAVKATAIATARLNDEDADTKMDLVSIPFFRDTRNDICLHVVDLNTIKENAIFTTESTTFNVASKTSIKTAAGAIANSAREESSITLISIGRDATFNSIRSVALARQYLQGRDDDIDIFVKTEMTKIQMEDDSDFEEMTAVKITCFLYKGSIELLEEEN